ncbi:MAG: hypothetical protein Q9222_006614 [Ikaeria aurantiellina]
MAERIPHRQSSTSSRTQPRRDSTRSSNADIFSDEYALDHLDIQDGTAASRSDGPEVHLPPLPGNQTHLNPDQVSAPIRRSHGSAKRNVNDRRSSLLSRYDSIRYHSPHGMQHSIPSGESPVSAVSRTASQMSTFTLPRTQSPYQGASGPSHPYGMYPQDIDLIRTPSMATTSTIRPRERSYAGPSGPNQPYSMYPQNTVPEDESNSAQNLQPPGMIGFPGRSHDYRRRLGPDVEDADDLIGPDGYTEQLPPYTRWPDNIPPKGGALGAASILSAERGRTQSSEETLANPFQSRESLTNAVGGDHSSTGLTAVAENESPQGDEGGSFKERVKHTSKKRTCFGRVPLWIIVVLALVVIAVLAGTIGGVVGHAQGEQQATPSIKPPPHPPQPAAESTLVTVTTTSLVDATPLPYTPINLPTLPTGVFSVPLRSPTISQSSCLSTYADSWSCANGADLKLDLSIPNMISVSPLVPIQQNEVHFGPQPPDLTMPVPLTLMGDRDGMEKGPAWWFQQPYTKVVVVPGRKIDAGGQSRKRWFDLPRDRKDNRRIGARYKGYSRTIATPSMKPWFCYWNSTILEGFIYVTQNSSTQSSAVESSDSASPSNPSAAYPSVYVPPSFAAFTSFSPTPATPTGIVEKRQASDASPYAVYSKDIKIEERRAPGTSPPPYCVQMQIMNDGTAQPLPDPNGQPWTVQLDEIQPGSDGSMSQDSSGSQKRGNVWERDSTSAGSCECEWINS